MSRNSKISILFVVIVLLFVLNTTSLGNRARSRVIFLLSPISSRLFLWSGRLASVKNYVKGYGSLIKENAELRDKNSGLEQALVAARLALDEEDVARIVTAFAKKKGFEIIPARIITKTGSDNIRSFIIDKGSRDNLENGQVVIVGSGILAGKIIDVKDDYSIFRFVTDEESRFTAGMSGKADIAGVVRGRLGLGLNLELVPRELVIAKDDVVITAGIESGVPDGLIIGKVLQIFNDPQNPLQRAILQPAASLNELRHVGVIRQVYRP